MESRVGRRHVAEAIVQDAFIGFLTSLPNYDGKRPLETYLFSICAYKLTDHLRREGRRPALPLSHTQDSDGQWQRLAPGRGASSIARSGERRSAEKGSAEKGTGPICAQHPPGRSGKLDLSPFPHL